ncbi:MAG: hypothetical protein ACI4S3_04595 [Candidatus Gastranaerophilaceae bacterium]
MLELIKTFINSQIFAVIVTVILTFLSTLIIDKIKFNRDERIYLKRKRECLYQKMYDTAMRFEKDIRNRKAPVMSNGTIDVWNEIQIESIYGKHETIEMFYDLFEDLQKNLEQKDDMLEIHAENNKRILEFYRHIKGELGIKD